MKLSEAIRAGIKKDGFQVFNTYFQYEHKDAYPPKIIGCCAMGAAFLGVDETDTNIDAWIKWPELNRTDVKPPVPLKLRKNGEPHYLFTIVTRLNDEVRWTREAIADWLESIGY